MAAAVVDPGAAGHAAAGSGPGQPAAHAAHRADRVLHLVARHDGIQKVLILEAGQHVKYVNRLEGKNTDMIKIMAMQEATFITQNQKK